MMRRSILAYPAGCIFAFCSVVKAAAGGDIQEFRYIGHKEISASEQFRGARLGGLSGVDYDPETGLYNFISDARGEGIEGDPRFFSARIITTPDGIENFRLENVQYFFDTNGERFKPAQNDFEAMRKTPAGYGVFVASERNSDDAPSIFEFGFDGSFVREFGTPPHFSPSDGTGARSNAGFEALAISNDGTRLFAGMETALIQDGPTSSKEAGAVARIVSYRLSDGAAVIDGQYGYICDPMSAVVDMVYIDKDRLIVLERSYTGTKADGARLYVADLKRATDISKFHSLGGEAFHKAEKSLLFDLKTMGVKLHNVEGITLGPALAGGGQLLLAVSDNNFNAEIPTQLFAFEIHLPKKSSVPLKYTLLLPVGLLLTGMLGWRLLAGRGRAPL